MDYLVFLRGEFRAVGYGLAQVVTIDILKNLVVPFY